MLEYVKNFISPVGYASIFFEKTKIQDRDTLFHPLPRSTLWTEATVACAWIGAEGEQCMLSLDVLNGCKSGQESFFGPRRDCVRYSGGQGRGEVLS